MSTAAPANPTPPTNSPAKSSYDVSRPQGICHVSGETIAPGEKFMAALRETPEGFVRIDVALAHWDRFDRAEVIAFWQTAMPLPQQKKKVFVDDAVLGELFERLGDATEPGKINFRFLLGLILMRKRLLTLENTRKQDERDIWSVRPKGRERAIDLIDPKLDEQQMLEVSRQLGEILNEEL
jgi:hypothetical protein